MRKELLNAQMPYIDLYCLYFGRCWQITDELQPHGRTLHYEKAAMNKLQLTTTFYFVYIYFCTQVNRTGTTLPNQVYQVTA